MVKKLSCVICGSLKRFPHTFTKCACAHARESILGSLNDFLVVLTYLGGARFLNQNS